ncbi:MAG: IS66 family transposase, partial [Coxiellaceae bacterium]|nr:IS66 family transposase [Coxiellaceae bacterium]
MKLLLEAISTLCTLQVKMEQDDITLHKLRKLLGMVKQSERRRSSSSQQSHGHKKKKSGRGARNKKPKSKPQLVHHKIEGHGKGDACPECARGKLYKFEPGKLLRITGHARYEAIHHVIEQLRCNACQIVYKAKLPESVLADGDASQRYGYSARSLMVIDKFYTGTPYYHQSNLAGVFGENISASTIYDQCEQTANSVMPVFYELKKQAADAKRFLIDDTPHRILKQQAEMRDRPDGKGQRLRSGVYCSGLIATRADGHEIILFDTSLGHAGEHLDAILKNRDSNLPSPVVMSDALSSNQVTSADIIHAYCNAHARRQFYDLESRHPEVDFILKTYAIIWKNESDVREQGVDDNKRLEYHKTYSLPAMQAILRWVNEQESSADYEAHSALAKAMSYFKKHYERLILFCVEPGVPIDNNRMEEKLKIPIRGRKTAHFYKTVMGAGVANVLISILATADQAGENIFDYLNALQRHYPSIKENPSNWLPWNYRAMIEKTNQKKLNPDRADGNEAKKLETIAA